MKRLFILLLLIISSKLTTAQWTTMNHTPNSESYSMVEYNNELYIGGAFNYQLHLPGPTSTDMRCIAKWNGVSFDTLGFGMEPGGYVLDMCVYDSSLIVAGGFLTANEMNVNMITKWNGTSFDSLGSGIIGQKVMAVAEFNGELYAGGIFTQAGNVPVNNIAKWNGITWDSVGSGVNNQIRDLVVFNGELYACGYITSAGGVPVNNIARWDGTSWTNVSGGLNNMAMTMKVYSNELYVGGLFNQANSMSALFIAKWDGTNWEPVGAGLTAGGVVQNLETYNGNLIVSGAFYEVNYFPAYTIAKWDGKNWSTLGTGTEIWQTGADVNVTLTFQGDLFVSGTFQSLWSSENPSCYIARYHEVSTGLENKGNNQNVLIYPNPTSDQITFVSTDNGVLIITDQLGQIVQKINIVDKQTNISTETFAGGLYILTFQSKNQDSKSKLIVYH